MQVTSITIENFRNFISLETSFLPSVNVFIGSNGSGKTNLLEAIFSLCLGRSQRGAGDSLMLRNGSEFYRLSGEIEHDGTTRQLAVAYQRQGRKKITVDGIPERLATLYDHFCAVSAGPEDSAILSGPPASRRGFMDIYMSQLSVRHLSDLTDYQKVLAQKNAALKREMDPSPFEPLQVTLGARIMQRRLEFIASLRELASNHYAAIAGGETLELSYEPSVRLEETEPDVAAIEQAFREKLQRHSRREQVMQTAMVGPHRDELRFDINGFPARTHGSQGQWRTGAISLKLAIYELLKSRRGSAPILLLDEIFAELDRHRAEGLIGAFGGFSQLFLTTAVEPPEILRGSGRYYRIEGGVLEEVN